ncbi:hypothetical protein D3C77_420930 [compost metagenome]
MAKGFEIRPFVTQDEANQYRDTKLKWLNDPNNEPQIEPIYFTRDRTEKFINETSKELIKLFKKWEVSSV